MTFLYEVTLHLLTFLYEITLHLYFLYQITLHLLSFLYEITMHLLSLLYEITMHLLSFLYEITMHLLSLLYEITMHLLSFLYEITLHLLYLLCGITLNLFCFVFLLQWECSCTFCLSCILEVHLHILSSCTGLQTAHPDFLLYGNQSAAAWNVFAAFLSSLWDVLWHRLHLSLFHVQGCICTLILSE